jgi:multiple sugar transport system substrate-binding protein
MKPRPRVIALTVAATLLCAACTPAPKQNTGAAAQAPVEASGTIEFWHPFTEREAKAVDDVLADFQAKYPKIHVKVTSGQDDPKMLQAISAGKGPDVGLSYSTDIVGKFCSSGAWQDLTSYVKRDDVDLNQFPDTVRSYTEYHGKRCAMPFLADTYGLYYNKKLLAEAGYSAPPKTTSELADMAKKLTKKAADGSIDVAGFVPLLHFYEHTPNHTAALWDAKWLTQDEKSAIGNDPNWPAMLQYHQDLVNYFGFDALQKFTSGLGDEFSADNAFHKGKLALMIDGEFRIAFLRDQAPDLEFGTAPLPVPDNATDRYGAGYVTGNVIGISSNSTNPEAAWTLIRYLTTDTGAVVKLANLLRNVPTTKDALASKDLKLDPEFRTFVDIFSNPKTATTPPSSAGPKYIELTEQFIDDYQAGKTPDLKAGLAGLDKQIDQALELGK